MNLYNILNVSTTATTKEIRTAYKKLATKYHPDKGCKDDEMFRNINIAYTILSNDDKRNQYDNTILENNDEQLYDILMSLIPDKYIDIYNYVIQCLNLDLQDDINEFNISNIIHKLTIKHDPNLDIKCTIMVSLEEICTNKIKKLFINRSINGSMIIKEFNIPIFDNECIVEEGGDENGIYIGNLIVTIENEPNEHFYRINKYDLVYPIKIPIDKYNNGYQFDLKLLDKSIINIKIDNTQLVHTIKNKGIITNDYIGKLYIYIIII